MTKDGAANRYTTCSQNMEQANIKTKLCT